MHSDSQSKFRTKAQVDSTAGSSNLRGVRSHAPADSTAASLSPLVPQSLKPSLSRSPHRRIWVGLYELPKEPLVVDTLH